MESLSDDPNADRLLAIETQLAHLQRFVDQLNDVVTDQAKQLFDSQRTIARLQTQVRDLRGKQSSDDPSDPVDEKPPHY